MHSNRERTIKMEYYLSHEGVSKRDGAKIGSGRYPLGSGKRPFQNYAESYLRQNIKGGKDKPNQSRGEVITRSIEKSVNSLETARRSMQEASDRKRKGKSAEGLSDEELRKTINRLQMERTYESLTKPETKSGYLKAQEILSVVGTTVTIAAAATAIASNIYTMKNPIPSGYESQPQRHAGFIEMKKR